MIEQANLNDRQARATRADAKLIRNADVLAITGLSRSTIHRLKKSGDFPEPVQLNSRAIFWFEDEVKEWARRLRKHRGKPPGQA